MNEHKDGPVMRAALKAAEGLGWICGTVTGWTTWAILYAPIMFRLGWLCIILGWIAVAIFGPQFGTPLFKLSVMLLVAGLAVEDVLRRLTCMIVKQAMEAMEAMEKGDTE